MLLNSLYIVSTEVYTDICLKAVRDNSSSAGQDRENRETRSSIEKRYVDIYREYLYGINCHMINFVINVALR